MSSHTIFETSIFIFINNYKTYDVSDLFPPVEFKVVFPCRLQIVKVVDAPAKPDFSGTKTRTF